MFKLFSLELLCMDSGYRRRVDYDDIRGELACCRCRSGTSSRCSTGTQSSLKDRALAFKCGGSEFDRLPVACHEGGPGRNGDEVSNMRYTRDHVVGSMVPNYGCRKNL